VLGGRLVWNTVRINEIVRSLEKSYGDRPVIERGLPRVAGPYVARHP
jgi:hypothetical protein